MKLLTAVAFSMLMMNSSVAEPIDRKQITSEAVHQLAYQNVVMSYGVSHNAYQVMCNPLNPDPFAAEVYKKSLDYMLDNKKRITNASLFYTEPDYTWEGYVDFLDHVVKTNLVDVDRFEGKEFKRGFMYDVVIGSNLSLDLDYHDKYFYTLHFNNYIHRTCKEIYLFKQMSMSALNDWVLGVKGSVVLLSSKVLAERYRYGLDVRTTSEGARFYELNRDNFQEITKINSSTEKTIFQRYAAGDLKIKVDFRPTKVNSEKPKLTEAELKLLEDFQAIIDKGPFLYSSKEKMLAYRVLLRNKPPGDLALLLKRRSSYDSESEEACSYYKDQNLRYSKEKILENLYFMESSFDRIKSKYVLDMTKQERFMSAVIVLTRNPVELSYCSAKE